MSKGAHLSLLFIGCVSSACTINIYHAPGSSTQPHPEGPGVSFTQTNRDNNNLLVIPDVPAHKQGALPERPPGTSANNGSSSIASSTDVPDERVVTERIVTQPDLTIASGAADNEVDADSVLQMQLLGSNAESEIPFMDPVELKVQVQVDAYLNCYYQQADGGIIKIFPNRFSERYWVYAGQDILLPNDRRFQIIADSVDGYERFMCLASNEDVMARLSAQYRANMFQTLPIRDFDALYALYRNNTASNLLGRVVSYSIQ